MFCDFIFMKMRLLFQVFVELGGLLEIDDVELGLAAGLGLQQLVNVPISARVDQRGLRKHN
jgi:hypothetical protein